MIEGNRNKKFCLLFCFFFLSFVLFYSSLLAVLIKISKRIARALLLLRLLHRLLLLYWLPLHCWHWLPLPLLLLHPRRWRRERPELLHYRHGQSRLLSNHLVKEADTRGVLCSIALVLAKHDVAPSPFVIHQLPADGVCAQDGIEVSESAQVVLRGDLLRGDLGNSARVRHSVYLGASICQLACFW